VNLPLNALPKRYQELPLDRVILLVDEDGTLVRPRGSKHFKNLGKVQLSQLHIDQQQADAAEVKANAFAMQAQTTRDELMFKIIALNPNSAQAQEWIHLKLNEGLKADKMRMAEIERAEKEAAKEKEKKNLRDAKRLRPMPKHGIAEVSPPSEDNVIALGGDFSAEKNANTPLNNVSDTIDLAGSNNTEEEDEEEAYGEDDSSTEDDSSANGDSEDEAKFMEEVCSAGSSLCNIKDDPRDPKYQRHECANCFLMCHYFCGSYRGAPVHGFCCKFCAKKLITAV